MSNLAELFPNSSAAQAKAEMVEALETNVEEWEPHSGGLDEWIADAVARLWSILMQQTSTIGNAALGGLGKSILEVPPILAAPAVVMSTWTAIDDDGHEIEDGTEVKIAVLGGDPAGFVVVGDVTIAPGDTSTAAGEVLLQAIIPGTAGNNLSADPSLVTALNFIDSITLEGVTANGVDEEDEDTYLGRLVKTIRLLSLSLIVGEDFEIDACAVAGVARALCVEAYDNEEEEEAPLCNTTFAIDADGVTIGLPAREELQERQAAKVPSGVKNFVGVPTTTGIDLEVEITVLPGYDPEATVAAVQSSLSTDLAPANSGLPAEGDTGNSGGWVKQEAVYRNELIAIADRVAGVDRVVTLKLAKEGDELKTQESVALPGVAPLTKAGDIEVSIA